MAIARFPIVVLDCPDPKVLAEFYGTILDWAVEQEDDEWWMIRAEYGDGIGFQKVAGFTPPQWPGQERPQQMHLDVSCLLYTSPSPRDGLLSRMPSSA